MLFGATGDLARRKLLPGIMHLLAVRPRAGVADHRRLARRLRRRGLPSRSPRRPAASSRPARSTTTQWAEFAAKLLVRQRQGRPGGAREGGVGAGGRAGRLAAAGCTTSASRPRRRSTSCTRSTPPNLVERSRIIMEKPFGTDLASAKVAQRPAARGVRRGADLPHRPLPRQGGGAQHPGVPLRQRPVRADLEPQLHRPRADRRARDAVGSKGARRSTRAPARSRTWS